MASQQYYYAVDNTGFVRFYSKPNNASAWSLWGSSSTALAIANLGQEFIQMGGGNNPLMITLTGVVEMNQYAGGQYYAARFYWWC